MRLFYAVTFQDGVKKRLSAVQNILRANSLRGNFTLYDNLHLTLVFVGEVPSDRVPALAEIAEETQFEPFALRISGLGQFRRGGGDIVWAGVEECPALEALRASLAGRISSAGFSFDSRPFRPHLTLAREFRPRAGFSLDECARAMRPIDVAVEKVHLMNSERAGGRLKYTPIA